MSVSSPFSKYKTLFLILTCLRVFVSNSVFAQGQPTPFSYIRIGDVDGFGFGDGKGYLGAGKQAINSDSLGVLTTGDLLPDLDQRGEVKTGEHDNFDNRSEAEVSDDIDANSSEGVESILVLSGAKNTDISAANSFEDHFAVDSIWSHSRGDYGPGSALLDDNVKLVFEFEFTVRKDLVDSGQLLFLNTKYGDYDASGFGVNILINGGDSVISLPITQIDKGDNDERDGAIQGVPYDLKFEDIFTDPGDDAYHGHLIVEFNRKGGGNTEPYIAVDFVEISTIPIEFTPIPSELIVEDYTIQAGDTVDPLEASIYDQFDEVFDYDPKDLVWTIVSTPDESNQLTVAGDGEVNFTTTKAHRKVLIEAVYTYPKDPQVILKDTATIVITAADPYGLDIQTTSETASLFEYTNDISIQLKGSGVQTELFAVIRDEFGNYIEDAVDADWESKDEDVVTLDKSDSTYGINVDMKGFGQTEVIVEQSDLKPDQATFIIPESYIAIEEKGGKDLEYIDYAYQEFQITLQTGNFDGQEVSIELTTVKGAGSITVIGTFIEKSDNNFIFVSEQLSEGGTLESLLFSELDTLVASWSHPDDASISVTDSMLIYKHASIEFVKDTMTLDQFGLSLIEWYPEGGEYDVPLNWFDDGYLDYITDVEMQRDSGEVFTNADGIIDAVDDVKESEYKVIVATYEDVFGKEVSDTAWINLISLKDSSGINITVDDPVVTIDDNTIITPGEDEFKLILTGKDNPGNSDNSIQWDKDGVLIDAPNEVLGPGLNFDINIQIPPGDLDKWVYNLTVECYFYHHSSQYLKKTETKIPVSELSFEELEPFLSEEGFFSIKALWKPEINPMDGKPYLMTDLGKLIESGVIIAKVIIHEEKILLEDHHNLEEGHEINRVSNQFLKLGYMRPTSK